MTNVVDETTLRVAFEVIRLKMVILENVEGLVVYPMVLELSGSSEQRLIFPSGNANQ